MSVIQEAWRKSGTKTGVLEESISPAFSRVQIAVEGDTGDVAVRFKPFGFDGYQDVADNVLSANSNAVFEIGSHAAVELTPVNTGNSYKYLVCAF